MTKWVYTFSEGTAQGRADMKNLLGGKGANLAEMANLGLPVPPGFTITTEVCTHFFGNNNSYPASLKEETHKALTEIEQHMSMRFGDVENPLLVSVRSGGRASMPGMMDTVLNLGLNDQTVHGLAARANDPRFAYDSYRRFIQMYSNVVLEVDHFLFEDVLDTHKRGLNVHSDTDLGAEDWQEIIHAYKQIVLDETGKPFPQDVTEQLWGSIGAVFKSWMNNRAITYRKLHDIPESWGTAVNVQAMVFGNMGQDCATGVAFTRDPATGANDFYGEYLINAQGEDVVAGIRTPQHLTVKAKTANGSDLPAMEEVMPEIYDHLCEVRELLEKHYRDAQDLEFTVQEGRLYMLQTRTAKRTTAAALKIAVDMANENIITTEEAICRIVPESLDQLLHPTLDPDAPRQEIASGLPASPGAVTGKIVFSADEAERQANLGDAVILCRIETSPEDIHGMHAAQGILTTRGGMTSHAAVVARGMGRACVAGAGAIAIDYKAKTLSVGTHVLKEGDIITIDGARGEVYLGTVPTRQPKLSGDFATLMGWADKVRRLKIRTNADTPHDAKVARDFGAEGIGLCRTEHMFFDEQRILAVRQMILADSEAERKAALDKIAPMQKGDFVDIFKVMEGRPVTIRLLDPPLHEFLPHSETEMQAVADAAGVELLKLKRKAAQLHEANPMLGHRGCRLGLSYPEIYDMQARAILEAAAEVQKDKGKGAVKAEIMIPLVGSQAEFEPIKSRIITIARQIEQRTGQKLTFLIGTMIELPRACMVADKIAHQAEFFSFGTNDLTQTTLGISRDDAASFLPHYQKTGVIAKDPFVTLDTQGVGALMRLAAEKGRSMRDHLKLGICGEHGGDPASIEFCESLGLDYVSCSPYRVPIARLAAAQAALNKRVGLEAAA